MKTWYCVTSSFDDKGNVKAAIVDSCECESMPKSEYFCTSSRDIYKDWFDSMEKAQIFVEAAYKA